MVVRRERALQLAERVLQGLDEGQGEWPLSLVRELYVFGSFARGATEPHDLACTSPTASPTAVTISA